uniref:Uncharacterized protein n=1 Tax=Sander lucioperca TaxID=283035 RepID=A0A8C9XEU8_SANLU
MLIVRIWRKQNEIMEPSCLVTTVQAGGGGVMVWGMLSYQYGPTFLKNASSTLRKGVKHSISMVFLIIL